MAGRRNHYYPTTNNANQCSVQDHAEDVVRSEPMQVLNKLAARIDSPHVSGVFCVWSREIKSPNIQGRRLPEDSYDMAESQKLFNSMNVARAHLLEEEADHCWSKIDSTRDVTTLTWAQFEELFLEKYFSAPVCQGRIREFLDLK
ncbi:hypothetical protein U1Q18_032408 [Sarracenia purpurea var. burkii]